MRVHCTVRQTLQFDILRFYILKEQYNEIFIIQTSVPEPLANRLKKSSPLYADFKFEKTDIAGGGYLSVSRESDFRT